MLVLKYFEQTIAHIEKGAPMLPRFFPKATKTTATPLTPEKADMKAQKLRQRIERHRFPRSVKEWQLSIANSVALSALLLHTPSGARESLEWAMKAVREVNIASLPYGQESFAKLRAESEWRFLLASAACDGDIDRTATRVVHGDPNRSRRFFAHVLGLPHLPRFVKKRIALALARK